MSLVDISSRDQVFQLKHMGMVERHDFGKDVTILSFQVTQF